MFNVCVCVCVSVLKYEGYKFWIKTEGSWLVVMIAKSIFDQNFNWLVGVFVLCLSHHLLLNGTWCLKYMTHKIFLLRVIINLFYFYWDFVCEQYKTNQLFGWKAVIINLKPLKKLIFLRHRHYPKLENENKKLKTSVATLFFNYYYFFFRIIFYFYYGNTCFYIFLLQIFIPKPIPFPFNAQLD